MNTALALLVDVLLKSTVLLLFAGLLSLLLRRASAAARHLHWQLTLAGLLALPLLAPLLPSLHVTLPAPLTAAAPWLTAHPLTAHPLTAHPVAAPARPLPPGASRPSPRLAGAAVLDPRNDSSPARAAEPSLGLSSPLSASALPAASARDGVRVRDAARTAGAVRGATNQGFVARMTRGVLLLWALGATVVLVILAVGLLRVGVVARAARPLQNPDWVALVDRIRHELGLRRRVRLLVADGPVVPMTWGLRAPVVLLPADASDWSTPRRRHVLLHELAHVQRCDWLTQLLAQLACAVYWFQPLAWVACKALRRERERACDDHVLLAGGKASEYAEHLLEIATSRGAGSTGSFAALAMARRSQLEGRLLAVLDHQRDRRRVAARRAALAALLAAAVVVPLACMRPQADGKPAPAGPGPAAAAQPGAQPAPTSTPTTAPPGAVSVVPSGGAPSGAPPRTGPHGPQLRGHPVGEDGLLYPQDAEDLATLLEAADESETYSDIPDPESDPALVLDLGSLGELLEQEPMLAQDDGLAQLAHLGYLGNNRVAFRIAWGDDCEQSRWSWTAPEGQYTVECTDCWIRPTADDKGIAEMSEDSLLTIDLVAGASAARIEARSVDGQVQLSGRVGDHDATEAELRAALAEHLPRVLRHTGLGAESRVERIIEREGIPGVVAEIGRLTGDSARLKYGQLLIGGYNLTTEDRVQLLTLAARDLESDWAVQELLLTDTTIWLEDPQLLEPLVAVLASLDSDAYAAESISALLDVSVEKPEATAALLTAAAQGIESDAYLSETLGHVCSEQLRTPAIASAWLEAAKSVESDAYTAELLVPFLACEEIGDDVRATALKASAGIESDAYTAEVLSAVPAESLSHADARSAFLAAAAGIGSDAYLAEVLVARLPETADAALATALIGAAAGIESDAYMAEVLASTPPSLLAQPEVKAAFLKALDTIQSRAYQDEVRGLLEIDTLKDA